MGGVAAYFTPTLWLWLFNNSLLFLFLPILPQIRFIKRTMVFKSPSSSESSDSGGISPLPCLVK